MNEQVAFFNDMSKTLMQSAQECQSIGLQMAQSMLEESAEVGRNMFCAQKPADLFSMTAARIEPFSDKLCSYNQEISRVAADGQVRLVRVVEQHSAGTARAAKALADEVARIASEETGKALRKQQDALSRIADPIDEMADTVVRRTREAMGEAMEMSEADGKERQPRHDGERGGQAGEKAGQAVDKAVQAGEKTLQAGERIAQVASGQGGGSRHGARHDA
ncbi:phasin family protein [Pseudoduganella violacea]|uniref:Phasin domain-containing protein n=1 Tax=Pseudoduganella violacea TaxID=1715466 RepID=A0A7W5BCT0_9BURK|nr:phasin family protein [Pseudoduganella violacea]MBB3120744.1 hypothetical protein [Pseudoduganella violacea]